MSRHVGTGISSTTGLLTFINPPPPPTSGQTWSGMCVPLIYGIPVRWTKVGLFLEKRVGGAAQTNIHTRAPVNHLYYWKERQNY